MSFLLRFLQPIHLQTIPQSLSHAVQHHPKVVGRNIQGLANLRRLHLFHLPQHKDICYPLGEFGQTISERLPELGAIHYHFGFGFPLERTGFVIPKTLWDELMGQFVSEKLEIGKAGLTTQLSKVVADLVLQDTAQPAPFGRSAAKVIRSSDRGKKRFLDKIFCDLRSPHPKESVPVKAITMFLNPLLWISTGGDCGFRAFALGESHLLAKLTNRAT